MLMLMQMQCNYGAKHLRCYSDGEEIAHGWELWMSKCDLRVGICGGAIVPRVL
jgi:hypothetical protein